jgi:hypothetical protein
MLIDFAFDRNDYSLISQLQSKKVETTWCRNDLTIDLAKYQWKLKTKTKRTPISTKLNKGETLRICLVGGKERGRKENCGNQCMNLD